MGIARTKGRDERLFLLPAAARRAKMNVIHVVYPYIWRVRFGALAQSRARYLYVVGKVIAWYIMSTTRSESVLTIVIRFLLKSRCICSGFIFLKLIAK